MSNQLPQSALGRCDGSDGSGRAGVGGLGADCAGRGSVGPRRVAKWRPCDLAGGERLGAATVTEVTTDRDRRVRWLFRPKDGVLEDIDVSLLSADDENDRRLLIASEHPRFWRAIEEGSPEVEIGGQVVNAELHLAMHEVVANRILADTPPEFWETARRLTRHGYRRHDVLHMLGSVASVEIYDALKNGVTLSDEDVRAALWRLPGDNPPKRSIRHGQLGNS
jgi:hypothetical protein